MCRVQVTSFEDGLSHILGGGACMAGVLETTNVSLPEAALAEAEVDDAAAKLTTTVARSDASPA